ncbi:hypothetical protein X989_6204 [Burkholderia pseudomallei MSHR4378]|nr:hypothetical protein X989_6204 [Burkholderia pseudomallei MSHR4378]
MRRFTYARGRCAVEPPMMVIASSFARIRSCRKRRWCLSIISLDLPAILATSKNLGSQHISAGPPSFALTTPRVFQEMPDGIAGDLKTDAIFVGRLRA